MSLQAQKGHQVFPEGGIVAVGEHFGCCVFPGGGEMSLRAQKGLQVFPGGGIVAVGEHFTANNFILRFRKKKKCCDVTHFFLF